MMMHDDGAMAARDARRARGGARTRLIRLDEVGTRALFARFFEGTRHF
jgi:hypothetical protein